MKARVVFVALWCGFACSSRKGPAPVRDGATDVDPDGRDAATHEDAGAQTADDGPALACPKDTEDATPKVHVWEYLMASPARVADVTIWMRSDRLPAVPDCPEGADRAARCTARDDALLRRVRANAAQIDCILSDLDASRLMPTPVWYEEPYHLTDGRPAPVALAFRVGLDLDQIRRAAANPMVAAIDPSPGFALGTGFIPPLPEGCPPESASGAVADAKVKDIAAIAGRGRQPVMVEVTDEGVLPAVVTCDGSADCLAATASLWDRAVANTRQMTCIKRRLDQLMVAPTPAVPSVTFTGSPASPSLPPLGQPAGTVKAFGWGLTYEQGSELAKSPDVERLWTSSGLQFEPGTPGCPPDLSQPIPVRSCPTDRNSLAGKLDERTHAAFLAAGDNPLDVSILVSGGAQLCPLEACSRETCPAREAVLQRWEDENRASQRCVRALISEVGGASSSEVFYIVNAVTANLTWSQAQIVATHPHVTNISLSAGGEPPP
jgi:hypothetical protein